MTRIKQLLLAIALTAFVVPIVANTNADGKETEDAYTIKYAPETYDSLLTRWYSENIVSSYEQFFNDFIEIDSSEVITTNVPDSIYEERLRALMVPFGLPFNDVIKRYIVVYTQKRQKTMSRILGLAQYYFPMFEEELARQGMPLELRMLPVIESALSPTAVSRVGATGLWQFMYQTGKNYKLEITSFVDQRRDPMLATQAACQYLKDLYALYNDWTLAIAAYNCGPGNVNKAIKRAGANAKTYWDIYNYLPRETRGYIPSFIAATYAYVYSKQHNIEPQVPPVPLSTDTIVINKLTHFEQISSSIGTPMETLRLLNPQYKLDIIPALEKPYTLTLPQQDIMKYLDMEEIIHSKDTTYLAKLLRPHPTQQGQKVFTLEAPVVTYKVKSGDTLGAIANKHRVTVAQLMQWNKIRNPKSLQIGQTIRIQR